MLFAIATIALLCAAGCRGSMGEVDDDGGGGRDDAGRDGSRVLPDGRVPPDDDAGTGPDDGGRTPPEDSAVPPPPDDDDGDGFGDDSDCDDTDPDIHPGAMDPCGDGVDQDCSGEDSVCRTGEFEDSRAGDEQALQDLYVSTNGDGWSTNTGWSASGMSLSDDIHGVEVQTIDGELRVTEIDLRGNNLTGDIDNESIGNLQEMVLFNVMFNALNSPIPPAITNCTALEYLYLSGSDNTADLRDVHPHEEATTGSGTVHPGKDKGSENNVFTGPIPYEIDDLSSLKWLYLDWTDTADGTTRSDRPLEDGITSIPATLWNISTLEGVHIYANWNLAHFSFPDSIAHIANLENLKLGGGGRLDWDSEEDGFMVGTYPSDFGDLTNLRHLWLHRNSGLRGFPDLSGATGLTSITINQTDMRGGDLPVWLVDGTLSSLDLANLNHPAGAGFTGAIPEFGSLTGVDLFNVNGHELTGSIPESFWHANPDGIRKLDFSNNRLTSIGTTDLTHLRDTNHLRWRNNDIAEPWPELNWGGPGPEQMDHVWFAGNRYVFSHMLYVPEGQTKTTLELYSELDTGTFSYSPQKPFGEPRSATHSSGDTITLADFDTVVTHEDNEYQWQKDGSDIVGATSRSLTVSDAVASDTGTYTLVVTNPGVPDLTLTSEPIDVTVE